MNFHPFETTTTSPTRTEDWGRRLGGLLTGGQVLGLTGDLGSGKTCFVRGLAVGLEVEQGSWVRSPSFTLINEYAGRVPLIHIDLFRVAAGPEMNDLLLEDYFYSNGVSVIEWFDRLVANGPETYLTVDFRYLGVRKRALRFAAHGPEYEEIVHTLRSMDEGASGR